MIAVTQPRRVAAMSVARRVSVELGHPVLAGETDHTHQRQKRKKKKAQRDPNDGLVAYQVGRQVARFRFRFGFRFRFRFRFRFSRQLDRLAGSRLAMMCGGGDGRSCWAVPSSSSRWPIVVPPPVRHTASTTLHMPPFVELSPACVVRPCWRFSVCPNSLQTRRSGTTSAPCAQRRK